jgi:hypothetical protein
MPPILPSVFLAGRLVRFLAGGPHSRFHCGFSQTTAAISAASCPVFHVEIALRQSFRG